MRRNNLSNWLEVPISTHKVTWDMFDDPVPMVKCSAPLVLIHEAALLASICRVGNV